MNELNGIYGISSGVNVNAIPKKQSLSKEVDPVVKKKIAELDSIVSSFNRSIKVKVEGDIYVAEVYDKDTKKVVKTIPAEKVIEVRNRIHETVSKFLETSQQ
jgi:uncharacterized FlaG/YvyC family protein